MSGRSSGVWNDSTRRRIRRVILFVSAVLTTCSAVANLVTNSSFTQGYMSWGQPGTPAVGYSIVVSTHDGSNAARIDSRTQRDDAPRQNVTAALVAAGSGMTWTTRLWAAADAPMSVRCYLNLTDASGFRSELLAERVLRVADVWEQLEGTATITWTAPLTSAILSLRYEMVGEALLPGVQVDDVTIELDSDGDLLTDVEEGLLGTDPMQADSDGDGLPDAWESRNALDPLTGDAALDSDLDGFDNYQEYWAATDPRDASRFPGRTANPSATATAQNVLRYLALAPSKQHTVIGQHLTDAGPPVDEYVSFINGLYTATNRWPGLLALQYDDVGSPVQISVVNPYALSWWAAGGMVQIKWNPLNPWTGLFYGDRTFVSFDDVITAGTTANTNYMAQLVQVGDGLTELRDAGVVVLWRVCSEMNGAWFWWGRRDRQGYVDFWRHMYDYLVNQRGLDNLLWVYESDSGTHLTAASDYYYPGDDVVDVMGHNLYDDAWVLPFDAERLYRQYSEVYAIPQAGPSGTRDGTWSNLVFLDGAPSGSGGVLNLLPRLSYFAAWSSFWSWDPQTQQSTYRALSVVDNLNAFELMTHPRIVTRDDLDFSCSLPGRVSPLLVVEAAGGALRFTWPDVAAAAQYVVVEDGIPSGPFAARTGVVTSGVSGLQVPIPVMDTYYHVAGCGACGLGPAN